MTETKRKVEYQGKSGKFVVEITMTRFVDDGTVNADGWQVNTGRKQAYRDVKCTVYCNGSRIAKSGTPVVLDTKRDAKYIAMGAYATFGGSVYLTRANYDLVMATIAEMDAEPTGNEYEDVVAATAQSDTARQSQIAIVDTEIALDEANGHCPSCGSYCNGDCQSH